MDKIDMPNSECIFQCGNHLTKDTSPQEHVIPNAIGGRKTVVGFICNSCNHRTGGKWDAELARQLNPLSLLLRIKRQRKGVPPQVFPTSSGKGMQLHADGRMTIAKPSHELTTDGNRTQLNIRARSKEEMRKLLKGWQRKYPSLRSKSMAELMSTAQARSEYSSALTHFTSEFGGEETGRSLVKSALALVYDTGVDPRVCNLALEYLTNESANPCFGYFFDSERDLVANRPVDRPFHCVYVEGSSDTGTILGYVEFYSLHRMVLCLTESYSGRDFTNLYAIDPVMGEELSLDIDLGLSMSEVHSAFYYEKWNDEVMMSAVDSLFK